MQKLCAAGTPQHRRRRGLAAAVLQASHMQHPAESPTTGWPVWLADKPSSDLNLHIVAPGVGVYVCDLQHHDVSLISNV